MTVVARRFVATPQRTASETWQAITTLICQDDSSARQEFEAATGCGANSIVEEALRNHPLVVRGSGPRLRVYTLHGDDAVSGEDKNEDALSWKPTDGTWTVDLPCTGEDLDWVAKELKNKASHFTAYDIAKGAPDEESTKSESARSATESGPFAINPERFFNT